MAGRGGPRGEGLRPKEYCMIKIGAYFVFRGVFIVIRVNNYSKSRLWNSKNGGQTLVFAQGCVVLMS